MRRLAGRLRRLVVRRFPNARPLHGAARALLRGTRGRTPAPPGRPRVCFLLMHAWGMGGTIRTTLNLAGFLARDHEVEIVSLVRRRDRPFFDFPPGVTVTVLDDQRPDRAPQGRVTRLLRTFPSLLMHPAERSRRACTLWTDVRLATELRSRPRHTLIGTRPGLNFLAADLARRGEAAIGQEHTNLAARRPALRAAIARRYRQLDAVVCLTEGDRAGYRELLGAGTRLECIPNAVPPLGGARAALQARVIVSAGRLSPAKDFASMIRAFAQTANEEPDWALRICGGGDQRAALEQLIEELDLDNRVELTGPVRDMGAELARASIFAMSSRFEGFPMVLIEAMSKGLPIVSFDCPTGPREVVDDGRTGLLVPNGDVDALASAMLRLMRDERTRRRLGSAAYEAARRFEIDIVGSRWLDLLGEL